MAETRRPRRQTSSAPPRRTSPTNIPDPRATDPGPATSDHRLYQRWCNRVANARRIRQAWERRYLVEVCERFFLGNQHDYGELSPWFDVEDHRPVFNYIWATIQGQLPALYYHNPAFNVTPLQPATSPLAEHAAAMIEALLKTIAEEDRHLKGAALLAVLQNYFRIGALKIIYDPRMEPNPQAGQLVWQYGPDGQPLLSPETGLGTPMIDPETGEPQREPSRVMSDEVYRWRWVDAACLLLPNQGPDRSRWTWIGEEVYVPLEVAQEDQRFPASLRDQLIANTHRGLRRSGEYGGQTGLDTDVETGEDFVCYYECWDIWNKRYYIWADGQPFGEQWLVNDVLPDGVEDHPYALALGYNSPIIGPQPSPWPVPTIFQWLSIQREYNLRRQQITTGASRTARKIYYEDSTFPDEDEAVKALQSSDDMTAVKVSNLERVPKVADDPPMSADITRDVALLLNDFRAIAGVTAAAQQAAQPGQSPTEAGFAQQFASARDLMMRDCITELLTEAGQKMAQRLQGTLTLEKLVKIRQLTESEVAALIVKTYGQEGAQALQNLPSVRELITQRFGQEKWLPVTREAITFHARIAVVPGSMRARTTEVERQQLLAFLSTLGQAPQLALSRELLRIVAQAFEIESEPLLDELNALAHQMVEVNARQAGRYQGGENAQSASPQNTPGQNGGMPPQLASRLAAAMMGGER